MTLGESWTAFGDALDFALGRVTDDGPLNEREAADGHQYVLRILDAATQASLLSVDPGQAAFLPMLDSVRFLGAAGPDIDYDVAVLAPGERYRIIGTRGGASYAGVTVYGHAGEKGASAILASVDLDELAGPDGRFTYDFEHPEAGRLIVRQYFHDRGTQRRGTWEIERLGTTGQAGGPPLPTTAGLAARIANAANTLRWNAQLNSLWTPERRATPNEFVRQTASEIVAAIPNPDVTYAFTWWKLDDGEALLVDVAPPETRYWSLQVCDRWFQCFPDRRSNLNDRQVTPNADGTVTLVLADGDPGQANWLDTSGHRTGVMLFRWLHADPVALPTCRVTTP